MKVSATNLATSPICRPLWASLKTKMGCESQWAAKANGLITQCYKKENKIVETRDHFKNGANLKSQTSKNKQNK
jgi:hypothetical protein